MVELAKAGAPTGTPECRCKELTGARSYRQGVADGRLTAKAHSRSAGSTRRVANPPYRKMSAKETAKYKHNYESVIESQPNLYCLFMAACLQLLKNAASGDSAQHENFVFLRTYFRERSSTRTGCEPPRQAIPSNPDTYAPAPLTFVCNRCHMFRRFQSAKDLAESMPLLRKARCAESGRTSPCQWRQLDVLFVHWSGDWMPATPGRWEWNARTQAPWLAGEQCSICGSDTFKLNSSSPRIGQWHFYCANPSCGHKGGQEWRQNDEFTTGTGVFLASLQFWPPIGIDLEVRQRSFGPRACASPDRCVPLSKQGTP